MSRILNDTTKPSHEHILQGSMEHGISGTCFKRNHGLEDMNYVTFRLVLKHLSLKAKKSLRLVSRSVKEKVEMMDKDILTFTARSQSDVKKIMKFSHVKGINLILRRDNPDDSMRDDDICKAIQMAFPSLKSLQLKNLNYSDTCQLDLSGKSSDILESMMIDSTFYISDHLFTKLMMTSSSSLKLLKVHDSGLNFLECLSHKMTSLTKLVLKKTGVLDVEFCHILRHVGNKLQILELEDNPITGEALQGLPVRLDNLEVLKLLDNSITDNGLREIIRIGGAKLVKLFIAEYDVSGEGMVGFSWVLSELKHLNLVRSGITRRGLSALMKVVGNKLKYLTLPYKPELSKRSTLQYPRDKNLHVHISFKDIELIELERLCGILVRYGQHLSSLKLRSCMIDGIDDTPTVIDNIDEIPTVLTALERLDLFYSQLSNVDLSALLAMTGDKLKWLNLGETKINGESLVGLESKFINLTWLNLSQCGLLTDQGLCAALAMCGPHLRHLNLSYTNVSGAGLDKLNLSLPKIFELNLSCSDFEDAGLKSLLTVSGSQLKRLILNTTFITGEICLDKTFKLSNLSFNGSPALTDKGLYNMLMLSGNQLKCLQLEETEITGLSLPQITLPWIQSLILRDCQNLTIQGLFNFIRMTGKSIKFLDLAGASLKIKSDKLSGCVFHLPQLKVLHLFDCKNLTSADFCEILRIFGPTLKTLILGETYRCGKTLSKMPKLLPNLTTLRIVGRKACLSGLNSLLRTTGGKLKHLYIPKNASVFQAKTIPNCSIHIMK